MKKKIGAVMLAGAMACTVAVGLTACGGSIKPDFEWPEEGFNTSKNVEITFYNTQGDNLQEITQKHIDKFQELFPNIKVTASKGEEGGYDDLRDKINDQIVAGNQPNIAYCYPDHVALYNRALAVQPLDDFLPGGALADKTVTATTGEVPFGMTEEEKESFIEGYYNEGSAYADGKMYTLPFSKSTEVLYYNKTFFDAHEELKVPTTWEEMEQVCAKIKEIDTDPQHVAFGYDSESNWFITMCEQYGSPYTSATGEHYLFNNAKNKEFVGKMKEWYDKKYFTTQAIYGSYTSGLFTKQDCYMCIGSSAGATNQVPTATDGQTAFEVGIAPIPQVDPSKPKVISQGPSLCIFKSDDPQEVIASWLFVKYMTTDVLFQAEFSSSSGYMPVLNSTTMEKSDVYQQFLKKASGFSKTGVAAKCVQVGMDQENAYFTSPAFNGSSAARDASGQLLQDVFAGKSIEQAFADAIAACKS